MTTVVIPWRDTGHRADACRVVCDAYRRALPGTVITLTDSGHEPFNRAASRNCVPRLLPASEIIVVGDADTLPDQQSLRVAVKAAYDGFLHYPFTTCHYLTEAGTDLAIQGHEPDPARIEFSIPGAQGGVMVMRADAWGKAGGMDERFLGWGYEDNAWHTAVARTIGQPVRHQGIVWHLWHPSDRNTGSASERWNHALAIGEGKIRG